MPRDGVQVQFPPLPIGWTEPVLHLALGAEIALAAIAARDGWSSNVKAAALSDTGTSSCAGAAAAGVIDGLPCAGLACSIARVVIPGCYAPCLCEESAALANATCSAWHRLREMLVDGPSRWPSLQRVVTNEAFVVELRGLGLSDEDEVTLVPIAAPGVEKGGDEMNVVIVSWFLLEAAYYSVMGLDAIFAVFSGSMLLATVTSYETFISLPLAMATWGICGQQWLGFLCVIMIFVILGIGADNVFVLFDAWKQSADMGFGDDLEARFAWAYRRAGGAMLVTTATTIFCFVAAGFADTPTISGFGIFAALVVFWDFFLVMTLFASALMYYHYYFDRKNACCVHACSCALMGRTPVTARRVHFHLYASVN